MVDMETDETVWWGFRSVTSPLRIIVSASGREAIQLTSLWRDRDGIWTVNPKQSRTNLEIVLKLTTMKTESI